MDKKLGYAFTWLAKNKKDKTKELNVSLPMRDILLDVQATAEELYNFRSDIDARLVMDTAISLVEKKYSVDLSDLRTFLSIAVNVSAGDSSSYTIMDCDKLVNKEV